MTPRPLEFVVITAFIVVAASLAVVLSVDFRAPDDKAWDDASRVDIATVYEGVIADWPDSEHVPAARARIAELAYDAAEAAGTIRALDRFLADHPDAAQTETARAQIEAMRIDMAPWERASAVGDASALRAFLEDFPGHVAEPQAREALRPYDGIDLFELLAAGAIAVEARGGGVAGVNLTLRKLTDGPVNVLIPPGAYFEAGDPGVQSMVTTAPGEIFLTGRDPVELRIAAACANLHLREPAGADGLTLRPAPVDGPLARVLAGTGALDLSARQAAVWIMTDDATLSELRVLNTMTAASAAKGAQLVAEAGIDLRSLRIWDDMPGMLHDSLSAGDEAVALWVWSALERPLMHAYSPGYEIPYLALAAQCGCLETIDALIAAGADVNAPYDVNGTQASVIARAGWNRATVEHLLDAGAALDAPGLWTTAVQQNADEVVALLLERDAPPPADLPLLGRASGDADMVGLLLAHGQLVDQIDEEGRTPLHASLRSLETVRLLLDAGADPNARTTYGESVLQSLAWEGFANLDAADVLRLLLDAGADAMVRREDGDTLVHAMVIGGWDPIGVEILLAAGLDPNAVNNDGETPLHHAAASSYDSAPAIAAALINGGARRLPDARGQMPEDLVVSDYWAADELREVLAHAPD